jgi:hypothetical protein
MNRAERNEIFETMEKLEEELAVLKRRTESGHLNDFELKLRIKDLESRLRDLNRVLEESSCREF